MNKWMTVDPDGMRLKFPCHFKWTYLPKRTQSYPYWPVDLASLEHHLVVAFYKGKKATPPLAAFEFWYHAALSGSGRHFSPHPLFLYHPTFPGSQYMEALGWILDSFNVLCEKRMKPFWLSPHMLSDKSNLSLRSSVSLSPHQQDDLFISPSPLKI